MIVHDRSIAVSALRQAVPYLRLYKKKLFVLKAGGEVFDREDTCQALMSQVGILHQLGIKVVVVHGGGPQTSRVAESLGVETRFVHGRRVTCERTRDISTMVLNGTVNTQIVACCRKMGIPALGISGVDAGLVRATRRPPRRIEGESVDFGFVGDISAIETEVLEKLTNDGFIPVVSPLSADDSGTILNLNADGVASRIAHEMQASKLIVVTRAPGILEDVNRESSLISVTDVEGLERLERDGAIVEGMLPKVTSIKEAVQGGVPRVHVISYRVPDSLLLEIFTNEGSGTLVVADRSKLTAGEANPAQAES